MNITLTVLLKKNKEQFGDGAVFVKQFGDGAVFVTKTATVLSFL